MSVRMRSLRTFLGEEGLVHQGETFKVSPSRALTLERKRLAVPIVQTPAPGPSETQQAPPPQETKAEPEGNGVEVQWVCNVDGCGRTFGTKRGWQMHRKSAHPELQEEPEGLSG